MTYHNNTNIGLTTWNSEQQAYYLIPFAEVNNFFKELATQITVSPELVDNAHNFLSDYDTENEAVLLTLNEDLLTVAVINKNQKPSNEALASQLGWSLPKLTSFVYLWNQLGTREAAPCLNNSLLQTLFKLSDNEFDTALSALLT